MGAIDSANAVSLPGFTAATDLSTHQYKFVEIVAGTTTVQVCNATTDKPIGVLQNKPKAGQAAQVVIIGITPAVAGETVATGDKITVNAVGKTTNDITAVDAEAFGTVLSAGAVDELVTVLINCAH